MSLKDVICKEYNIHEIIPYQIKTISMGKIDFFVPVSYERLGGEDIKICYNVSELDQLSRIANEGGEAPYIATALIDGMRLAMDYYIFPSQFLLRERLVYISKNKKIKVAFVPEPMGEMPLVDPAKTMRKMTYSLLQELYNVSNRGKILNEGSVEMPHIVEMTMAILSDNSIGMDTCMRKLEKLKEQAHPEMDEEMIPIIESSVASKGGRLDLLSKFR